MSPLDALYTKRGVRVITVACSPPLSCVIREVRTSLFTVNNALEQQSGICHSRATCCLLEAKSFQPLASEHLGKNWGGEGGGGRKKGKERNGKKKKARSAVTIFGSSSSYLSFGTIFYRNCEVLQSKANNQVELITNNSLFLSLKCTCFQFT